jgi:hypothetical protein
MLWPGFVHGLPLTFLAEWGKACVRGGGLRVIVLVHGMC